MNLRNSSVKEKHFARGFLFFDFFALHLSVVALWHGRRKLNLLPALIKALLYVFGNLSANEGRV